VIFIVIFKGYDGLSTLQVGKADRTNGRACVRLSSSLTLCIVVAKQCVPEQKLQLTAYSKSYMRNRLVLK